MCKISKGICPFSGSKLQYFRSKAKKCRPRFKFFSEISNRKITILVLPGQSSKIGKGIKYKKIRGHKRIWEEIKKWEERHKDLDLDNLEIHLRNYTKVWVSPYCDYYLLNSETPEPTGKTRQLILQALLNIYDSWKEKLDQLDEPYYLKLWLHEPNISRSQVVCAIDPYIEFYNETFHIPETQKNLNVQNYGSLSSRIEEFNWTYAPEEYPVSIEDIGMPYEFASYEDYRKNKRHVKKHLKKPYRTSVFKDQTGKEEECSWRRVGSIWIGEK